MKTLRDANFFDLFIWLIVCISYASLLLLVFNAFKPIASLLLGAGATAVSVKLLRIKIDARIKKLPYALFAILLIALILRFDPSLYLPASQDQGVYVTMSAAYERNGSTFLIDGVRKKAIASGLKNWYDSANILHKKVVKKGKYEGTHLPGIYVKNLSESEYVFQFYPLHPIWMAIAGSLMGRDNRVYSLVLFSLLSIAGIYLLACEISGGSRTAGVIASGLLALNPLHTFFSKFPVTEIVALAFASLAFFYLARYYNYSFDHKGRPFDLVLSSALFGCMFFTRISGFIYIPFFYFMALLTILSDEAPRLKKDMMLYLFLTVALYTASVIYGLIYSYPYSRSIYGLWFTRLLRSQWELKLFLVLTALMLVLLLLWLFGRQIRETHLSIVYFWSKQHLSRIFGVIFIIIVLLAFYKAYVFAFTDKYMGTQWDPAGVGSRFHIAGLGFKSLNYSNIFVSMWYLSPVGLIILLYAMGRVFPRKHHMTWTCLSGFLCLIWFAATVTKFYTQYQFYYARYLVSELVPYSILAIGLALARLLRKPTFMKIISICLIGVISLYFAYFTFFQFKGKSGAGVQTALEGIAESVGEDDLLLLYDLRRPPVIDIQSPLSYFYGLNVCNIEQPGILNTKKGKDFLSKYGEVYLLSQDRLNVSFLKMLKNIRYRKGTFKRSSFIPKEFDFSVSEIYLYKVYNS